MGCFSARPAFAPPAKWHGQYVAVFFSRKKRVFEQKELLLSGNLAIIFSAKLMVHGVKYMSLLLIHFWSPVSEKSLSFFPFPKENVLKNLMVVAVIGFFLSSSSPSCCPLTFAENEPLLFFGRMEEFPGGRGSKV